MVDIRRDGCSGRSLWSGGRERLKGALVDSGGITHDVSHHATSARDTAVGSLYMSDFTVFYQCCLVDACSEISLRSG